MEDNLKKVYRDLETKVFATLRSIINNSNYTSKHINTKAIEVNLFDYTELCIVNDSLTFLDDNGQHYSIFCDCYLEDLIDLL